MLYDVTTRRGFLYDKMRNMVRANAAADNEINRNEVGSNNSDIDDLILYFKSCVVKDNIAELRQLLKIEFTILFLYDTQILFDFTLLFSDIDSEGLLGETWSSIKTKPFNIFNVRVNQTFPLQDDDFMNFIYLLKMMLAHRQTFEKSVPSFIKFDTVSYDTYFFGI